MEYREGPIELDEENVNWWEYGHYPPDSALWFRDKNGDTIPGWGEDSDKDGVIEPEEALSALVDFSQLRNYRTNCPKSPSFERDRHS